MCISFKISFNMQTLLFTSKILKNRVALPNRVRCAWALIVIIIISFLSQVLHFNGNLDLIVLEIVTAISKMGTYNPSYYTELLSDSGEFNSRAPTKNKLKQKFHGWREKLDAMTEALKSLKQSPYYKSIRFQRQLNMAYEQIFGMIEKYINGHHARKCYNGRGVDVVVFVAMV